MRARASIGGSFYSDTSTTTISSPWDLGYGSFVKFDHDFIGREALEKMSKDPSQEGHAGAERRRRVARDRLSTSRSTTGRSSWSGRGRSTPCIRLTRVTVEGKTAGVSTWIGYTSNEGKMLTLAVMDAEFAEPGTEVDLRVGRGERRLDGSRRSSAMFRPRFVPSSARCLMSRWCARATRPAAGARLTPKNPRWSFRTPRERRSGIQAIFSFSGFRISTARPGMTKSKNRS